MSTSPNLDLVRSIFADWKRGDFFSSTEWAHPEIEYVWVGGPEPGSWTGTEATEASRNFVDLWEDLRVEAEEYRELDGGRVLVLVHLRGRGKTSGLELGHMRAGAHLFHVRGGKVTRFVVYVDRDRALADLGLASEAKSPDTERPR